MNNPPRECLQTYTYPCHIHEAARYFDSVRHIHKSTTITASLQSESITFALDGNTVDSRSDEVNYKHAPAAEGGLNRTQSTISATQAERTGLSAVNCQECRRSP